MNVIVPVGWAGTRPRPHTHSVPRSLPRVGDKPIIGHILDKLIPLNIERLILIIGYLEEKIKAYVNVNYAFNNIQILAKGVKRVCLDIRPKTKGSVVCPGNG